MYCCGSVIKKNKKNYFGIETTTRWFHGLSSDPALAIAQWMLIKVGHTSYEDSDI